MKNLLLSDSYVPQFSGTLSHCRKINDHLVIFDREGVVSGVRTNDARLKKAKSFYDLMPESESELIIQKCNSFDLKWIIIKTDLGCAAVYTALYRVCKLLFGIIFIAPQEQARAYFTSQSFDSAYISPALNAIPDVKADNKELSLIDETFKSAASALSCNEISEIKYSLGTRVGKFLAEQIISLADLAGCVGECASLLEAVPRLDSFSPEIFATVSLCVALFARDESPDRRFSAKLSEYKERILISFCIEINNDFILYANRKIYNKLILQCQKAANAHEAYFDCSLLDTDNPRLILSCIPESDPLPNRRIKQDIIALTRSFWK